MSLSFLGSAAACILVLTVAVTPSAGGAPGRSPRVLCSAGAGRTLSRSHQVRVFARKGVFYSCWLASRRRTMLGRLGESIPDQGAVLATHVRIDGEFVAFSVQESGDPGYDVSLI